MIKGYMVFTPIPTFPQGGRSTEKSLSPVGETGKGVVINIVISTYLLA
jgi:hypothetical protein